MLRHPLFGQGSSAVVDSLLYRLSVYGVPALIALISLVAFLNWESSYQTQEPGTLEFRLLEDKTGHLGPEQAADLLEKQPLVQFFNTKLSESPFWITFSPAYSGEGRETAVELPSRHALAAACWKAADLSWLGEATRSGASGRIRAAQTGFVIDFSGLDSSPIVCQTKLSGPGRISVLQWNAAELDTAIRKFHRNSGLLDGGLIVLSVFVLMTALINREWMYVLFAAWLVANLRLAALSAGWDTQWLERVVPAEWIYPLRKMSMTFYYILIVTLFSRLFRDDLKKVGCLRLLHVNQWSCLPLLLFALVLPYSKFLPILWVSTAFTVGIVAFLLGRIIVITKSRVAMWYSASLAIALFSNLSEVVSAALGVKGVIGAVNSVTAALASSLMAAFAIAEQMRQERQERLKAQAELRSAYEAIPIGLFTLNSYGRFLQTNPALKAMLGVQGGKREYWSDYFEQGAWSRLQELILTRSHNEIELHSAPKKDEEAKCFLVKATLSKEKIEGSLQDITQRVRVTEKLRYLADHDPLTNIMNRRGIEKLFDQAMKDLSESGTLCLAYLDLDRFKLINDLFGHVAGDEVLQQVCTRVREMLTDGQEIGRVGGDEFVIVFQGTPVRSAAWTCHGIIERIGSAPYKIGDRAFQVKGSIGLIEVTGGVPVKDAISVADRACREAKSARGGNLVVYPKDAKVFKEREEELRMIERIGVNVAPEGLFLVMQPIMSVRGPYDSLNFEVLLRMREADSSITPAGKIIAAAESNGSIAVIDRWVLTNTLEWLSRHGEHLSKTRFVCVNLSGGSLNDEKFVEDAYAILAQYGRTAEKVCIEITESVALHDLRNTRRFIDGVRSFGAKIALDDFGAGYTSFSYLKELPADAVKIDGAFVKGVNAHPTNLSIVGTIVELARNLGMKSIAEWAEDRAIIEALAEVGVDYVQGFGIARPQDPHKILLGDSAASFIEDETVALYVRNSLAKGQNLNLWDHSGDLARASMH